MSWSSSWVVARDLWAALELPSPPAGGKDPFGVGVEKPPRADEGRDDEQAEDLVAAGELALTIAGLLLGLLFEVRLDAEGGHFSISDYSRACVWPERSFLLILPIHLRRIERLLT